MDKAKKSPPIIGKPEYMTQLYGENLVRKDHPRIIFRGKLDTLEAQVVLIQASSDLNGNSNKLISDLEELLILLRRIMKAEVTGGKLPDITLFGMSSEELQKRSHDPDRYYGVKAMSPPAYTMNRTYAALNLLRANVRETETAAVTAFSENDKVTRLDILTALNRASSAVYLMMCKCLSAGYTD